MAQPTISRVAIIIGEADHPLAKQRRVFPPRDGGDVQPAFAGRHIGDVRQPGFVRPRRLKAMPKEIGRDRMVVTAIRRHRQPALLPWHDQTLLAHEPGDPLSADAAPPGAQLGMDARTAIGLAALLEDLPDLGYQQSLVLCAPVRPATEPGIERARRDTDQPAQKEQAWGAEQERSPALDQMFA